MSSKRLKCPHCLSESRQVKNVDDSITCKKCLKTYSKDDKPSIKDEFQLFSDFSDDNQSHSDDYIFTNNQTNGNKKKQKTKTIHKSINIKKQFLFDDSDNSNQDSEEEEEEITLIKKQSKAPVKRTIPNHKPTNKNKQSKYDSDDSDSFIKDNEEKVKLNNKKRNMFDDSDDSDLFDNDSEEDLMVIKRQPKASIKGTVTNKKSVIKRKQNTFEDSDDSDSFDQDSEQDVRLDKRQLEKRIVPIKRKSKGKESKDKSTKLPRIFTDLIMPKNDTPNNEDLNLSFSDMDDELPAQPKTSSKEKIKRTNKQRNRKRKSRKNSVSSFDDSDNDDNSSSFEESDSENIEIEIYDPKRKSTSRTVRRRKRYSESRRPKLSFNPYIVFNKLMRKKIAAEHPLASNIEVSKLVSQAWKSMSEADKTKFKEEQQAIRDEMGEVIKQPPKKRPSGNGYILYSQEMMPGVRKEFPDVKQIYDLSGVIARRWKNLPEDEKQVYKDKALKERDDWMKEFPDEHQAYLDTMKAKIKQTKASQK